MIWFYIVMAISANGWVSESEMKVRVQMPDQATCEAMVKLSNEGECWAKVPEVAPATSGTINLPKSVTVWEQPH